MSGDGLTRAQRYVALRRARTKFDERAEKRKKAKKKAKDKRAKLERELYLEINRPL